MAERRLLLLGLVLLAASAAFLLWNLRGPVGFILTLRATKLAALLLVGLAVGVATVLFQTVAQNRLLTPGIVGFDALFVTLQTGLVLGLGGLGLAQLPALGRFAMEVLLLVLAAQALFGLLLRKGADDVIRMILTGVILGVMLRGVAGLMQRLLDPSEFSVVQQAVFASFGAVDRGLLLIAAGLLAMAMLAALRMASELDVAGLGRVPARTLGLDHDRVVRRSLALVSALVAVSTALVGPVTFLGLIAASLAHALMQTHRHAVLLPAAGLLGALFLVTGQFLFERVLGLQSTLAVLIEFFGGLLFLALILSRRRQ
ncbi:iron chelate uptake ABC transporter family permease subunit [Pseudoponticoccus marisrubri]|uniref:Enterobactin ABC transporter permease n=1 Tax=Pseudoponticoccus marisrubri TaxID=1685382 RepID=A0A0W7WKI8_9RHOB|nr:iron chelate uptake ABC transporter family permease subunit [Pseudoponticoccus marisrubri]KUF11081.1 enterobactin ABC transporter permease [Pseudoponticoccus marisrubri]